MFGNRRHHAGTTAGSSRRFGGRRRHAGTTTTTTTTTRETTSAGYGAPHHTHRRHASLGDKISGAMMRLRGSLTRRPGLKAAGARREHGTDGRGSYRY